MQVQGYLRSGDGYYLRGEKYPVLIEGWLLGGEGYYLRPYGRLRDDEAVAPPSFPTQYAGLRFYNGSVGELALVDVADAPAGPQWRVYKGAQAYAVYLVATTDPDASPIRVYTSAGVMAARNKT